jgi:hypothetical protein
MREQIQQREHQEGRNSISTDAVHILTNNRGGRQERMTLTLESPQCFAIFIFLFGFIGFLQGWKRTLVVMGFTLAAILFLTIGSASGVAEILFVRIPQTVNIISGGAIGPKSPPPPSSTEVLLAAVGTLVLAMALGFIFAGRGFGSPVTPIDRFIGIIPGLVTGYALISYVSRLFAANPTIAVGVTAPSANSLGNYIVVLVIIAIIAIVLGLITTRFGK